MTAVFIPADPAGLERPPAHRREEMGSWRSRKRMGGFGASLSVQEVHRRKPVRGSAGIVACSPKQPAVAETERQVALKVPWATLLKILAAIALVFVLRELAWLAMVVLIAIIIAVGLAPVVSWLERRHWQRWLGASAAVFVLVAAIMGFLILTWSSLSAESADLEQRLRCGAGDPHTLAGAGHRGVAPVRRHVSIDLLTVCDGRGPWAALVQRRVRARLDS